MSAERKAEAKARRQIVARVGSWTERDTQGVETVSLLTLYAALDAYAATIAARVDAEWRARVEGMRNGVGENASHRFDDLAHQCFMDTAVLPPGKDDPLASHSMDERAEVWRLWKRQRNATCDALLTAVARDRNTTPTPEADRAE